MESYKSLPRLIIVCLPFLTIMVGTTPMDAYPLQQRYSFSQDEGTKTYDRNALSYPPVTFSDPEINSVYFSYVPSSHLRAAEKAFHLQKHPVKVYQFPAEQSESNLPFVSSSVVSSSLFSSSVESHTKSTPAVPVPKLVSLKYPERQEVYSAAEFLPTSTEGDHKEDNNDDFVVPKIPAFSPELEDLQHRRGSDYQGDDVLGPLSLLDQLAPSLW